MKKTYEAIIVRLTPDIVGGEMLNVGVALLCRDEGFLEFRHVPHLHRVAAAFAGIDKVMVRRVLAAIKNTLDDARSNEFEELPFTKAVGLADLLARCVRVSDAMLQFSEPIIGVTTDPAATLLRHFNRFVGELTHDRVAPRSEEDVWRSFTKALRPEVAQRIVPVTVKAKKHNVELEFKHAWKNGAWNIVQPLSFDLATGDNIREKASAWVGRMVVLRPWEQPDFATVSLLIGDSPRHASACRDAVHILEDELAAQFNVSIVREEASKTLAERITGDVMSHMKP